MIYECTDCSNCADFADGFRLICLANELEPNEVHNYYPLGIWDAEGCSCFRLTFPFKQEFYGNEVDEAEKYSIEKYGEITYQGIKDWCIWKQEKDLTNA